MNPNQAAGLNPHLVVFGHVLDNRPDARPSASIRLGETAHPNFDREFILRPSPTRAPSTFFADLVAGLLADCAPHLGDRSQRP
jgi:hypothetical protein